MESHSRDSSDVSGGTSHYSVSRSSGHVQSHSKASSTKSAHDAFSFRSRSPVAAVEKEFQQVGSSLGAASSSSLRSGGRPVMATPEFNTPPRSADSDYSTPSQAESHTGSQSSDFAHFQKPRMNIVNAPPGTRASMMSHYSGVIQDADTDTIRYVVDPANAEKGTVVPSFVTTRKTSMAGVSDISIHSAETENTAQANPRLSMISSHTDRGYESPVVDTEPLMLETVQVETGEVPRPPDRTQLTNLEIAIPARSAKRPQSIASPVLGPEKTLSSSPVRPLPSIPVHQQEVSGDLLRRLSMISVDHDDKPKPTLSNLDTPTEPLSRHVLRSHSRQSSAYASNSWAPPQLQRPITDSASTFDNDNQSYHTAELAISETHDSPTTPKYGDQGSVSSGTSHGTSREPVTPKMSGDEYEDIDVTQTAGIAAEDPPSTKSKRTKRKKTRGSSSSRPNSFSYDTLARLLSATDGIVIGQEFAHLSLPNHEKFLLEQVVDSLGRLSAGMFINPSRYDQGCKRLQRVLDVLEGFEDNY
ncbi:unnamed protein product [Kuraishia capsulata CBS 1993]|uniref:Uncharacterized protein n=1 Tax=Kuraishia capsulata CBS 1993 TaxID=1382522 RepID=W6MME4_9ASCO|nr:uncharacterized protein KUCA_T00003695001 [Kuraishia capsulata CBS 1993]CDK27716.1 unnamed protein product [Kuraishia capsulata CBS 1993]